MLIAAEQHSITLNQSNDKNEAPEVCPGPGPGQDPGGVVLRRKPQRSSSYSHRASQRFSRLLEGVTSITSLVSLSSYTKEDTEAPASLPNTPAQDVEEDGGPASLPYWVEANQNIYKVSKKHVEKNLAIMFNVRRTASPLLPWRTRVATPP